jgi:hypothetical protein
MSDTIPSAPMVRTASRAELLALYRDGTRLERDAARRELDRRRGESNRGPVRIVRGPRDDWRRRQAGDA